MTPFLRCGAENVFRFRDTEEGLRLHHSEKVLYFCDVISLIFDAELNVASNMCLACAVPNRFTGFGSCKYGVCVLYVD